MSDSGKKQQKGRSEMNADYKNWMPKGMILFSAALTAVLIVLFAVFATNGILSGTLKAVISVLLLFGAVIGLCVSVWMWYMYRMFSYDGKRQMSRQIIEGIAEYVNIPEGGKGLDVGCGSGALAIACAKRNPGAEITGIDRWGKEYASFSKSLCEKNAKSEGVNNVSFRQGDAVHLDFPDESFDSVMSNYVYHNIPGERQKYLLETFRVLKKGGTFAIHDIFSKVKYGDMQAFVNKLKKMGYEDVRLIDTTDGSFMTRQEAGLMMLGGSAILVGKK